MAIETKKHIEKKGQKVYTEIVAAGTFYPAEGYHQKYYLKRYDHLVKQLSSLYEGQGDIVQSTVAARLNGYLGGNGNLEDLKGQLRDLGLSPEMLDNIASALGGASR